MTSEKPFLFNFSNETIKAVFAMPEKDAPTMSFRMPRWAYDKIDEYTKRTGHTKSEIAKLLIISKLFDLEKGDE